MDQGTPVAATTDSRRVLHALRPLVLLGGFVVLWWCLATGTAQASDGPHHGLGATTRALTGAVHQPVRHVTGRGQHALGAASRAARPVRHQTSPLVAAARTTSRTSPVASPLTSTTKTVHVHLAAALQQVGPTLSQTAVGAVILPATTVVEHLQLVGESSTLQGETLSSYAPGMRPSTSLTSAVLPASAGQLTSTLQGQDRAAPSSPVGQDADGHALTSTGSTGASAAPSGSGPGTSTCESSTVSSPSATKTSISTPAGRRCAGPAYPPSSSPG